MTIARKNTRPITVDNIGYRWMAKEADHGAGSELLLVVVANEYPNGEQLVAQIRWIDRDSSDAVTPGIVAELIRKAHEGGWDANRRGSCPACDDTLLQLIRSGTERT